MKDSLPCEASTLSPIGSPTEVITPRYALGTQPGSYVGQWTGQPVNHPHPDDDADEWVRAQTGYCNPFPGPSVNNYLVRRDPVALVSIAIILILLAMISPFITIWALNTLFPALAIPTNFYTWLAMEWINLIVIGRISKRA